MAIYPTSADPATGIAIQTWTEEAAAALSNLAISSPGGGHTNTVTLQIPLDDNDAPGADRPARPAPRASSRGEILRRDSLKRRELLLKGKDGSRRRQRWENGELRHL